MKPLPEYVKKCPMCDGAGQYEQTYNAGCGMGYFKSLGPCAMCGDGDPWRGVGYVYKATGKPVGASVLAQIGEDGRHG